MQDTDEKLLDEIFKLANQIKASRGRSTSIVAMWPVRPEDRHHFDILRAEFKAALKCTPNK